jgi:predicted XRE-type DNA-binding protein
MSRKLLAINQKRPKRSAALAEPITVTSGSVFHALGLENADDLVLRSALIRKVGEVARAKNLTQAEIAELLCVDQPRVSTLLAGKISKFSTDALVRMLMALGQNVTVRVTAARAAKGKLVVVA